MFSNFTWTKEDLTVEEAAVLRHWSTKSTGVFVSLAGFIGFTVGPGPDALPGVILCPCSVPLALTPPSLSPC